MRKFFTLSFAIDNVGTEAGVLTSYSLGNFSYTALNRCTFLGKLPGDIQLSVGRPSNGNGNYQVVINPFGWKIISRGLADRIAGISGNNLEVLPVRLIDLPRQTVRTDFVLINPLTMLNSICEKYSVRSRSSIGGKHLVSKLVIHPYCVPSEVHVFRVPEASSRFIVDDCFANALDVEPKCGLVMIPLETCLVEGCSQANSDD